MAIRKIRSYFLTDIAGIFCLHYLKLLIFAACIAFPLIYGTMHRWLEEYSRITLRPDVFAAIFYSDDDHYAVDNRVSSIAENHPGERIRPKGIEKRLKILFFVIGMKL